MMIARVLITGLVGVLLGRAAAAQPILDTGATPHLLAVERTSYGLFLGIDLPRAFAIDSRGTFGGSGTIEQVRTKAIDSCVTKGGTACSMYADNLEIVWPGRASQTAGTPGPMVST